jgi:hypothetical protein
MKKATVAAACALGAARACALGAARFYIFEYIYPIGCA